MYTLGGTTADAEFDDRAMVIPVEGAGPLRVTVVVRATPPATVVGPTKPRPMKFGTATISPQLALCPFKAAETETDVFTATAVVVIGNVAERLPAGMRSVGGTTVDGSLLKSVTVVPEAGATALSVTVPVVVVPPVTVLGEMLTTLTATDAPIPNPQLTVFAP